MITPGNQSVYLTWTEPYDGGSPIIEYQVFRGFITGQYNFIGITTNLFFNDTMQLIPLEKVTIQLKCQLFRLDPLLIFKQLLRPLL